VTRGSLTVVGLGPGATELRTPEAAAALGRATDLVGYATYLRMVGPLDPEPERHEFDNREEGKRARFALDLAARGRAVVMVSSGDPGVFAMATAVMEEYHRAPPGEYDDVELAVVPGVTAATAAAARVGAPLGHDFCVLSMSDVLKPWEVIEQRLDAAARADFVLALYNPKSNHRPWQLARALEIVGAHRASTTPVVVARDVGRPDEHVTVTTLGAIDVDAVDMRTLLLVGSSATRAFTDAHGRAWAYTPRRYEPA
jgi:cobalt-precorrin 5A hydrolase/precorrin-3B C17-methyltransferase